MLSALNTAASAADATPTQKPEMHVARNAADHQRDARNHQHAEQEIMSFEARARDPRLDQRRDRRRERHEVAATEALASFTEP